MPDVCLYKYKTCSLKTEVIMIAENCVKISTGWVNVNTKCNSRCLWCYKESDLSSPKSMSFGMAEKSVRFFSDLKIEDCIFIGGEPTLHPDLISLVSIAKQGAIKNVTIVTNGIKLSERRYAGDLAESGVDRFSISIHSSEKQIHETISGVKKWDMTMKGIKNTVELGVKCSINLVAGKENLDTICQSARDLLDLGVSEIVVSCALPRMIDSSFCDEFALSPLIFSELARKILFLPQNVVLLMELPLCILDRTVLKEFLVSRRLGSGCHVGPGNGLVIDVDGNIVSCNSLSFMPLFNLFDSNGKIKYSAQNLINFWSKDQEMIDFRTGVNVYRSESCLHCGFWEMCNCGCPMVWGCNDPQKLIRGGLDGLIHELT